MHLSAHQALHGNDFMELFFFFSPFFFFFLAVKVTLSAKLLYTINVKLLSVTVHNSIWLFFANTGAMFV